MFSISHLTLFCIVTAAYANGRLHQRNSRCSENLPEYHRRKRNCTPLKPMKFNSLTSVTCNDGSPAGYYFRRTAGSRDWLIYLEGGGYCYNKETCKQRKYMSKNELFSLVSLRRSSKNKTVSGILSTNKTTNPIWWNANHVYVPYCSSDIWTGNNRSDGKGFSFLGARIIDGVIDDLWEKRDLKNADNLTLAGSSAGGTGVMFNIDRVGDNLEKRGSNVRVRGVVDSGWFLDNDFITSKNCGSPHGRCKQSDRIRAAMRYWNADLPERCAKQKTEDEIHLCMFGSEIYATLKRPVFIFQWIYDLAQIVEDNPELHRNPRMLLQKKYFAYMPYLGRKMRNSLKSVRSYFAPSCLGHTVLTREHWLKTQIGDKTLLDALRCWLRFEEDCQIMDKCIIPHCSKYCANALQTRSGEIPIRLLPIV